MCTICKKEIKSPQPQHHFRSEMIKKILSPQKTTAINM